ncbi:MAG: phosphate uptake regulator PhoU [Candidatus Micrarchaeia archaeon]|jgi:phosphate uptake regulator
MPSVRRVQLTGTSTYTISLPKEWAKRKGIAKGARLTVLESAGGSLVLDAENAEAEAMRAREEKVCIDSLKPDSLRRKFIACYIAGSHRILFYSKNTMSNSLRQVLLDETRRLIGMEVTDETGSSILVRDFYSQKELSVERAFGRMHLLVGNLFSELCATIRKENFEAAKALRLRDDEVDRLKFLILRQLNLALSDTRVLLAMGLASADCIDYAIATRNLEHIADDIAEIGMQFHDGHNSKFKEFPSKKLDLMCAEASRQYHATVKAFLESDCNAAEAVLDYRKCSQADYKTALDELSQANKCAPVQYTLMLAKLDNSIASACAEIAEITLNRTKRQVNG